MKPAKSAGLVRGGNTVPFDFKRMTHREFNVGMKEQRIRYGIGSFALLVSVFLGNIPLLALGSYLVASGYMRWCPVYSGMSRTSVRPGEEMPKSCCGGAHSGH
jgi:Protein of unknown function (DUF2892)